MAAARAWERHTRVCVYFYDEEWTYVMSALPRPRLRLPPLSPFSYSLSALGNTRREGEKRRGIAGGPMNHLSEQFSAHASEMGRKGERDERRQSGGQSKTSPPSSFFHSAAM